MNGARVAAALALTLAAAAASAGGHMVYIPQYYVIPGQKPTTDEVCVAPAVAVGEKSKSQNGDVMEVVSLNGRSKLCRDKDKPILAHVLLTPAGDFNSTLRIGLPPGLTEQPITDRDRFYGKRFAAEDRKRHLNIQVHSWRNDNAGSFNAWIWQQRSTQIDGNGRTTSRVEELEIDGCEARRWDLIGEPGKDKLFAKGIQWSWVETYVKGEHEFVWIEVGVRADQLDKYRAEINAMGEALTGLKTVPTPAAAAEPASDPTP